MVDRTPTSVQLPLIVILGSLFILVVMSAQVQQTKNLFSSDLNMPRISEDDYGSWQRGRITQTDTPTDLARVVGLPYPNPSPHPLLAAGSKLVNSSTGVSSELLYIRDVATVGHTQSIQRFGSHKMVDEPKLQPQLKTLVAHAVTARSEDLVNVNRLARQTLVHRSPTVQRKSVSIGQDDPERQTDSVTGTLSDHATCPPGLSQKPAPLVDSRANQTWCKPTSLLKEIKELENFPVLATWCHSVHVELDNLFAIQAISDPRSATAIGRLQLLSRVDPSSSHGQPLLAKVHDTEMRTRLLTTAHSVSRRAMVWQFVHLVASRTNTDRRLKEYLNVDPTILLTRIAAVRRTLGNSENGEAWGKVLMLDNLQDFIAAEDFGDSTARTLAAVELIGLWEGKQLAPEQLKLLQHPTFVAMRDEVNRWGAQPISLAELLRNIEQYESKPTRYHGTRLAAMRLALHHSPVPEENQLADVITTYYRNANIRLSMNEKLMNCLIPVIRSSNIPVRDMIFGMEIRGKGWAQATTEVNLLPDDRQIHLSLETNGRMGASTRSSIRGIDLFTKNRSSFQIRKLITWNSSGMYVDGAHGRAQAHSQLTGFRTDYDGIPLIGSIVRKLVRKGYDERNGQARRFFENKVSSEARQTLDKHVEEQLAKLETNLNNNVIGRLHALKLDPAATDMQTTEEQVAVRLRLAGDHQLAAYTPRPEPLQNHLLSLQLHESTLNNVLEQLQLEGLNEDLRSVCQHISHKLRLNDAEWLDEIPENTAVEFASRDAVRVRCDNNQLTISMKIKRLKYGRSVWKYFIVKAHYHPHVAGLQIEFSRNKYIELIGRRLRLGDQVALRGVFSKVFSKNRRLTIIPPILVEDKRLANLSVDQLTLANGWVGLSIGETPTIAVAREHRGSNRIR